MTDERIIEGRYRLDALAATGGMGSVYRAFDLEAKRACAVKLLNDDRHRDAGAAARARAEVASLAKLDHEAVVRYFDSGDGEAGPYLVMEWVEGETLRDKLARDGLRVPEALRVAARIVQALATVHAGGIVHRDVTPRNVMLEHGDVDRAKLVDFGIARVQEAPGLTASGVRMGTPRYMAPEQILNARRVDGRADVFSLGCILFEMVTGRRVFDGDDEVAVLARVLIEDAPRASEVRADLPPALDGLLARMLERDPRKRPVASEVLARDLTTLAIAPSALPPVRALSRRPAAAATIADDDVPPSVLRTPATATGARAVTSATTGNRGPLIGRDRDVADLLRALVPGAVVSLWGPVGAGKSRVLYELERSLARLAAIPDLAREVAAVDLQGVTTAAVAVTRVANGLGLGAVDSTTVRRALANNPTVLLFDAPDAALEPLASEIATWRDGAPGTTFVIASRRRFELATATFELGPLGPEAAFDLFKQRIRERGHDAPLESFARTIQRLEGNPLLIELAAARYGLLGAEGLEARLARPLDVLDGARSPAYRSTLEEALNESWAASRPTEQRALAALSTFTGPFAVSAAEAVLANVGVTRAFDVIQALRDQSLLARSSDDRLGLSEPVRELAARKCVELGLEGDARLAHAHVIVSLAEAAGTELARTGADAARKQIVRLERELEAVGERAPTLQGGGGLALRSIVAADPVLVSRVPLALHLRRLDDALAHAEREGVSNALLQHAKRARGRILSLRGRAADARAALEAALALAREADDAEGEALTLLDLGVASHRDGALDVAARHYEAVLALRVRYENTTLEARALGNLGAIAHDRHDLNAAYRRYVEAIALVEGSANDRLLGVFLGNLAVLDRERGALVEAKRRFIRAHDALERVGDVRLIAVVLGNLGLLELERGRLEVALSCLTRARGMLERVGDAHSEALAIARQAAVLASMGRLEDAHKAVFLAQRAAGTHERAREVVSIAEGFALAAEGRTQEAHARIESAQTADAAGLAPIDRSDDTRALVRILEHRLANA